MLRRVTQRRSEREVLVLLLEDLHWFDAASRAFLDELIPTFPGTRTLVLVNFRPEFQAPWMTHSYYRQVPLAPLVPEAVDELIGALVGDDPSLAGLPSELLGRTGGNPFFLEEIVRSLVEDGTLAGEPGAYRLTRPLIEARVPETVHAVLAARIDRLPASAKETLQTASVIGRSFPVAVLEHITGRAADLALLCNAEFLQADGDDGYRFWHPLTQDVAYRSLLIPKRRSLHDAVARALIAVDAQRLDERAALIATHFAEAGEDWHAAQWEDRAAQWAQRRDFVEATERWLTVLSHLSTAEETDESRTLELQTRSRLLRAAAWSGLLLEEREAIFDGGVALAEQLDDKTEVPLLYASRATELFQLGRLREAYAVCATAVTLAEEHPSPDTLAVIGVFAGTAELYGGSATEALRFAELTIARSEEDPGLGAPIIGCGALPRGLHFRAEALILVGRPVEARTELDRAVVLLRERREPLFLPWVLAGYARLSALTGCDHLAEDNAAEAVRIAEQAGGSGLMMIAALEAHALSALVAGRYEGAAEQCLRALAESRRRHTGMCLDASLLAYLGRARLGLGDEGGARAAAGEAVEVARRQGARIFEVLALLVRGEVNRSHDDLRLALVLAGELGASAYEPFCLEQLARLDGDPAALAEAGRRFAAVGAMGNGRRLAAELAPR